MLCFEFLLLLGQEPELKTRAHRPITASTLPHLLNASDGLTLWGVPVASPPPNILRLSYSIANRVSETSLTLSTL